MVRQTSRSDAFGEVNTRARGVLAPFPGLDAAGTLDRGRVNEHQVVVETRAVGREHADQRFDRVGQLGPPLMEPRSLRRPREQMREVFARDPQETLVRRDPHHRLRYTERDDLLVGQHPSGVTGPLRQEIVGSAEHRNQQQVEVGEHRGPLGSTARIGTADFDLTAAGPYNTAKAVELLI